VKALKEVQDVSDAIRYNTDLAEEFPEALRMLKLAREAILAEIKLTA
jgi:hypothetical protein